MISGSQFSWDLGIGRPDESDTGSGTKRDRYEGMADEDNYRRQERGQSWSRHGPDRTSRHCQGQIWSRHGNSHFHDADQKYEQKKEQERWSFGLRNLIGKNRYGNRGWQEMTIGVDSDRASDWFRKSYRTQNLDWNSDEGGWKSVPEKSETTPAEQQQQTSYMTDITAAISSKGGLVDAANGDTAPVSTTGTTVKQSADVNSSEA